MKLEDLPVKLRSQLEWDVMIFGNGYFEKHQDGTFKRIDPMKMIYEKKWQKQEVNINE